MHNLRALDWSGNSVAAYDWAARFELKAREMILAGEHAPLVEYRKLGPDAALAIPTPDHFLPLLHVLGAQQSADRVSFPVEGAEGGSISMLTVKIA